MHTQDQIEAWRAMWRQATAECDTTDGFVTRFAALVAASERERVRAALLAEAGKWVGDFRMPVHRAISDGATAAGLNITLDDCYAAIRNTAGG